MSFVHDSGLFISFSGGLCPYWLTRSTDVCLPTHAVHTANTSTECDPRRPTLPTSTPKERRRVCRPWWKFQYSLSSSDVSTLMQYW